MKGDKNRILVPCFMTLLLFACAEEPKQSKKEEESVPVAMNGTCPPHILNTKENNLNISVLLDLSDRIEMDDQVQKDLAYLSSLAKAFLTHVKGKKLLFLEDRLQLYFNPEPSGKINEIAEKLSIAFNKDTNKDYLNEAQNLYDQLPSELYDSAKADAQDRGGYPGSDIWRFFEHDVKDYCMDDCHRNILVILTDGYMFYYKTQMVKGSRTSYLTPKSLDGLKLDGSDWRDKMAEKDFGFIPATNGLQDLEVLVIGINGENGGAYSQDIVESFWIQWLQEMGVDENKIKIKNADIPKNIEKVIFDFILNK
ncbi:MULTISPECIES: hypothetical protein [Flavobacteriaceae]|uniref:hypothetical protein n=1 Tax=Flavobacteriaceae TaxID=49546 RepID=UPI0023491392|nr:hypothetical protein [Muricauda sp. SP22]MDC6363998.1 hypothetical protein [Muricauda sp. SP22]